MDNGKEVRNLSRKENRLFKSVSCENKEVIVMKKSWKKLVGIAVLLSASLMLAALPVAAQDETEEVPMAPEYEDYLLEEEEGEEALVDSEGDEALIGLQTTSELVFYPLTPCRIVDTRFASRWGFNPIPSGGQINLDVYGDTSSQGGRTNCFVNSDAAAVVINVTAIPVAGGDGFLTVWPFGLARPLAALVNYNPADAFAIGNATVQTIRRLGADQLSVYALRSTHVTIDVSGYLARPTDTPLDTTFRSTSRTIGAGGNLSFRSPACPAGYRISGGGCHWDIYNSSLSIIGTRPWTSTEWNCDFRNGTGGNRVAIAHGVCVRMPGR
jgi:hypothetical protein